MSKWADYLVSGVFFITENNSRRISHVMLHVDSDSGFKRGIKTSEAEVIKLIKAGKSIFTMTWNYPDWHRGAEVTFEKTAFGEFLRTEKNSTIKDNLDNSFPYVI